MKTIKLYGGPAHLHEQTVRDDESRLSVKVRNLRPPAIYSPLPDIVNYEPIITCSYYVREFRDIGVTEAGATVYRSMWVGIYECADLLPREHYELMDALSLLPWQWREKPNFLTQFDQWCEYTLDKIGWGQPKVRQL